MCRKGASGTLFALAEREGTEKPFSNRLRLEIGSNPVLTEKCAARVPVAPFLRWRREGAQRNRSPTACGWKHVRIPSSLKNVLQGCQRHPFFLRWRREGDRISEILRLHPAIPTHSPDASRLPPRGLAAARSHRGSDSPPDCHSLPRCRFATPRGEQAENGKLKVKG